MHKYKVTVHICAYPNGTSLKVFDKYFDNVVDAKLFCKKNNWQNPMETSTAIAYIYEAREDWYPII